MFTRYKGISIPENYSGNRFKAPIETETKTHKPTQGGVYGGTKTSISPIFESAIKERTYNNDINETLYEPTDSYQSEEEAYATSINESQGLDFNEEFIENQDSSSESEDPKKNSILGDFASIFSQITSKIKQDDFIIIGVILLLLSEKGEDKDVILPLLLLLLYA